MTETTDTKDLKIYETIRVGRKLILFLKMSGALEGVAQNWLTDQPWQKVLIALLKFISYMF